MFGDFHELKRITEPPSDGHSKHWQRGTGSCTAPTQNAVNEQICGVERIKGLICPIDAGGIVSERQIPDAKRTA